MGDNVQVEHLNVILDNCKYYDTIINYTPTEQDLVTKDMIRYYQDYIFFNWDQLGKIKLLDEIMNEYLKNRKFYKYIQMHFREDNDFLPLYDVLVNLYNNYQVESIKKVDSTKWI